MIWSIKVVIIYENDSDRKKKSSETICLVHTIQKSKADSEHLNS